ncbi:hypothetical protein DL769_004227 [Monosporascus sp. CRB-8-3]|nr:hypothetical protein DL769_004227 [Monosporascus sp. CRB-8-3]
MTHRNTAAEDDYSDEGGRVGSTETTRKNGSTVAKEYDSEEWLAMRPDVTFDRTQPDTSKDQLHELRSWFGEDLPDAPLASHEPGVHGAWIQDPNSESCSEFPEKAPENLESALHGSFSSERKLSSPTKADNPLQKTKQDTGGLGEIDARLGSHRGIIEEIGAVLRELIDQNEKLVSRLGEIKQSQENTASHETDQGSVQDLSRNDTAETSEMTLEDLRSLKAKSDKEARNLKESNKYLKVELSKTKEELKTKAALLWEQDFDLRDCRTKVEKLQTELRNCVPVDNMVSFDIRAKTPLESMQEMNIKNLEEKNKDLEKRVEDLEEEIQELKGHER